MGNTERVKLTKKLHNFEFVSKFKQEQEKVNHLPATRNVHPAPKSSARKTPCYLLIYFFENNLKNHDPKKNTFGRSLDSRWAEGRTDLLKKAANFESCSMATIKAYNVKFSHMRGVKTGSSTQLVADWLEEMVDATRVGE